MNPEMNPEMKLPATVTAGELVTRATPTAQAVWAAVRAGTAVLFCRSDDDTWE